MPLHELFCNFFCNNRLPVQWTLNNGRQIAQRAIYKSYSVRISDVQTSDSGSYKCSDGSDEYKIQLIVEGIMSLIKFFCF